MADNQEEVVYQFTGDVSSLRQATEAAIGFLGNYQAQIDRISSDGGFGKSARSIKSFQTQVNAVTKQLTAMQKQAKGVSDVRLYPSSQVSQQLTSAMSSIHQVFDKLDYSTALSTKEVQALTAQLRGAASGLRATSSELTTLVQREQKWQQTLENTRARVTQFRTSLEAVRGRVSSVFDPMMAKINQLSVPLAKITSRMQSFRDKAAESLGRVSQLANTVASAFRRVSSAEGASADATNKSTHAHSRLRSILVGIQSAFKRETSAVSKEQDELERKNDTLQNSTRWHTSLRRALMNLGSMFSSETNRINVFNTSLRGMSGASKLARTALTGLISIPIAQWLSEAAKQSISYAENVNLFRVAMGDSLDVGTKFIEQMAEIYGMNPSNLMRYAGNFYQLADAIEMPDESAAKLSLNLLKMTNDISSLFNVPIEEVFEDLAAGMQGMSRAVRKYGMDIRTSTLQQTALSLGITQNVENMSEANRQGLRYITMMRQASNASGDFARTIESPANQLKIFKEQLGVLGRSIGNLFIGPLTTAISFINGFIMALSTAISFIAAFFGIFNALFGGASSAAETADGAAESIDNIGGAAGGAAKELKKMLAPFDELYVLQSQQAGGGGGGGPLDMELLDPAIAAEIEAMELQLENIRMKAVEVRDALLEFFGFEVKDGVILSWDSSEFEANLIDKFPQWTQTIKAVFANWTDIIDGFKNVFTSLSEVVQAVWSRVLGILGAFINDNTISAFISDLSNKLNSLATFLSTNKDSIADFVIILGALATAFRVFSTVGTLVAPVQRFVTACSTAFTSFGTIIGWVGAIAAAIAVLYNTSDSFASSFDNLLGSVVGGLGDVFTALWSSLQGVWDSIKKLWSKSILPMLTDLGDALAPVITTVISLWEDFAKIIVDAFKLVESVWTGTISPVLEDFLEAVGDLAKIFKTLWSGVIGPVVDSIGSGLQKMWSSAVKPVFENVIAIVGGVIEIILTLWNGVLSPLVSFVATMLAPVFGNVFSAIGSTVLSVVSSIISALGGLITMLRGVIDFIAGVFTGDWSRAWQGVVNVFAGVWQTITGVVKSVLNGVIGVINVFLGAVSGVLNGVINAINQISFNVPKWVPGMGGKSIQPNIPNVGRWSIPTLATGGAVASGQLFVARENGIPELVGNFGGTTGVMNNQQIVAAVSEGVYNAVLSAMGTDSNDSGRETIVEVDGEKLFKIMVGRNRRAIMRTGTNPMGG